MRVIAFDSETHLIAPGLLAPPIVCVQWKVQGNDMPVLCLRENALPFIEAWLESDDILVLHNAAFDMAAICAQWPALTPLVFAKYDRDQITDTKIRDQLIMISRGQFRSYDTADGESHAVNYDLADCVRRHFGTTLKKEGFRMFYRAFDGVPIPMWDETAAELQACVRAGDWPEWMRDYHQRGIVDADDINGLLAADPREARSYALEDTVVLDLYESQERVGRAAGLLEDEFRQARAAFALHLSSCRGVHTDTDAVNELDVKLTAEFEGLQAELQEAGLIRANGTADTKAAAEAMVAECEEEGLPVLRTAKGAVSMGKAACERFDKDSLIGQYSEYLRLRKTLRNDIKMLHSGCEVPIQPRYGLADTGRTTCAAPNIQAINRGAHIREAFRPREGYVFAQCDFPALELHTLGQWCKTMLGYSRLADRLNADVDVHTAMAAILLGISSDEAMRRKALKDKEIKEYRQRAKALNFGKPGGLGNKKFVRYAKSSFNVVLTEAEAAEYDRIWKQENPEVVEFFARAAAATNNSAKLGDEEHLFTGRKRGGVRYSALCNGRFQGLGADCAKEALWRVTRACYADPSSPLYGCYVVAFVHDELILEVPIERASAAAFELERLMAEGANIYLPDCPIMISDTHPETRMSAQLMTLWSKDAEPVYDADGNLVPWEPKTAA